MIPMEDRKPFLDPGWCVYVCVDCHIFATYPHNPVVAECSECDAVMVPSTQSCPVALTTFEPPTVDATVTISPAQMAALRNYLLP